MGNHHSKFSPSRLARIIACPGSVQLCEEAEEQKQSSFAAEGSLLHLAIERCLDLGYDKCLADVVSPELNKEQRGAVNECIEWAQGRERQAALIDPGYIVTLEQQVSLEFFDQPDVYGTSDYGLSYSTILEVADWKFGKGVEVFAEDNDQLNAYVMGKIKTREALAKLTKIIVWVIQPRINNFSKVELSPNDLLRWLDHTLAPALDSILQKKPPFCPGEKQCRWCDAKLLCVHRHQLVQEQAAEVFKVHARLPNQVDNNEVARLLTNAKLITDYLKDLQIYAMNQIKCGKGMPGYKVVAGRSNRSFKDQDDAKDFLTLHVDEDDLYTKKFVSPAQAEKVVDKEVRESDEFQALIEKPAGKPTLAIESDRRPALPISASNVFSNLAK